MSLLLAEGGAGSPVNYTLTCETGTYVYTGQDATFQVRHSLTCDAGAYAYTGQAATLDYVPGAVAVHYTLACDAGSYTYSGNDATLSYVEGVVVQPSRGGGGRYIGYLPPYEKKKPVVTLQWTDDKEQELIDLLRKIDEDFEKKREQQFRELIELLRTAIYLGNEVSISGFDYLKEQDLVAAKRKLQQEEEEILLLVA